MWAPLWDRELPGGIVCRISGTLDREGIHIVLICADWPKGVQDLHTHKKGDLHLTLVLC